MDSCPLVANADQADLDVDSIGDACDSAVEILDVSRLKITLKFAKPGRDSIFLKGSFPIPSGFNPSGKLVSVDVGGSSRTLTLDGKGRAKAGMDSFRISIKSRNGIVEAQDAKFLASFKRSSFASFFTDEGLLGTDVVNAPVEIVTRLFVDGNYAGAKITQIYSAKQGKSGKTK